MNNIEGLISATFGAIYENGSDAEGDEALRNRVIEKIAGPAENGNKQHYKTWCESIDGVGRARIFPLWLGENTVKAVLIDTTGKPCGEAKVQEVQEYIDPADKGMTATVNGKTYTIGDGLGNGVANIGAHFTAVAATRVGNRGYVRGGAGERGHAGGGAAGGSGGNREIPPGNLCWGQTTRR